MVGTSPTRDTPPRRRPRVLAKGVRCVRRANQGTDVGPFAWGGDSQDQLGSPGKLEALRLGGERGFARLGGEPSYRDEDGFPHRLARDVERPARFSAPAPARPKFAGGAVVICTHRLRPGEGAGGMRRCPICAPDGRAWG